MVALETINQEISFKLRLGMEFNSEEAAYEFYNKYALTMGFSIRKDTYAENKRAGEITSRVFVCCKQGYLKTKTNLPKVKNKAETRTRCDAGLFIKLNMKKNNWFVNHFTESHNHLLVMQECAHMPRSQRKITASQAMEVDLAEEFRILLKSIYELMGRQVGGRESLGYTKLDQKNYLITKRQKSALSMFMGSIEEEDEFLSAWDAMLEECDVRDNNWLKSIFELREKWTYAYNKQAWSAGINNTELSESFNASLKDYLKSDFSVAQFFMHFDRVVNDKKV